jgi:DUF1365 family protein
VLGSIEARDHLGDPGLRLRTNVEAFLARHGVGLGDGDRVLLAALPRAFGYCFNPISVFWCLGKGFNLENKGIGKEFVSP